MTDMWFRVDDQDNPPPKDGTQIIVFSADGQLSIAEYYQGDDGFCAWEIGHTTEGRRLFLATRITHWMPLPEPPK